MAALRRHIAVQADDFDPGTEMAAVQAGRTDIGAITSFVGLCRDEGGRLEALELEHYTGMAEAELGRVVDEALARWPLQAVTLIHRFGMIRPGERIVLVVTASPHRAASFEAAEFLMDFLKTRAPFWKKEHGAGAGDWIAAKAGDDKRAERWSRR